MHVRSASWSVLALGVAVLFGGCAQVQQVLQNVSRPSAEVTGVRLGSLGFERATLVFDVAVTNPLSVALPLLDLDLDLASGDRSFASAALPLGGVVAAGATRTLEAPVEVDLLQTLRTLSSVRPGQVVDYRAELGLSIDVPAMGRQRLPLVQDGELPIPAVPRVSIDAFRMDDVGLTGVTGTTVLRVGNPNAFAVGLEGLDVGLRLGGRDVGGLRALQPLRLAEEGEGLVEIPMSLSTVDLGSALLQIFRGSSADYGLNGSASLSTPFGDLQAPIDVTGSAPVQR